MPRGCAIYIPVLSLIAIDVSVHQWNYRCSRCVIPLSVGLDVARFDLQGSPRASDRGASIVQGFTLEPKYDLYFADIQQYNNGNSMN